MVNYKKKKIEITKVKRTILAKKKVPIANKVNDIETENLLREIKKTSDLVNKVIVMHNLLAKSLWQYRLQNILIY